MKAKVLRALRQTNEYVSGQELCDQLEVSRTAIWKAVQGLRKDGYDIRAISNKGYRLLASPDYLRDIEGLSLLNTTWLGQKIAYKKSIDSTNKMAKKMSSEKDTHGMICLADHQTEAKGRRGRSWETQEGSSIYMSAILKLPLLPQNASMMTLVAAIAVVKALNEQTGMSFQIKWPNDIIYDKKKVCGILTEMICEGDYVSALIVGIGININQKNFDKELFEKAISLAQIGEKDYKRDAIFEAVVRHFESEIQVFMQTQDLSSQKNAYESFLISMKKPVVLMDGDVREGICKGISKKGELLIEDKEGIEHTIVAGEVSVRGVYGYVD